MWRIVDWIPHHAPRRRGTRRPLVLPTHQPPGPVASWEPARSTCAVRGRCRVSWTPGGGRPRPRVLRACGRWRSLVPRRRRCALPLAARSAALRAYLPRPRAPCPRTCLHRSRRCRARWSGKCLRSPSIRIPHGRPGAPGRERRRSPPALRSRYVVDSARPARARSAGRRPGRARLRPVRGLPAGRTACLPPAKRPSVVPLSPFMTRSRPRYAVTRASARRRRSGTRARIAYPRGAAGQRSTHAFPAARAPPLWPSPHPLRSRLARVQLLPQAVHVGTRRCPLPTQLRQLKRELWKSRSASPHALRSRQYRSVQPTPPSAAANPSYAAIAMCAPGEVGDQVSKAPPSSSPSSSRHRHAGLRRGPARRWSFDAGRSLGLRRRAAKPSVPRIPHQQAEIRVALGDRIRFHRHYHPRSALMRW